EGRAGGVGGSSTSPPPPSSPAASPDLPSLPGPSRCLSRTSLPPSLPPSPPAPCAGPLLRGRSNGRRWRQEENELPKKVDSITPYTMALIAKYIARHRLRETRLLDTIADFLIRKAEYLDSKVIQKLVFPFSRMSYRPSAEQQFFSRLEEAVELKALSSPLATVNILMSLFQLGHFPGTVLHRVFSSAFINSPYALIVRRYLSLLDAAVELEYRDYIGPRLQDAHKVLMFDHALTADEVNRKYSYKGLVAEALRQLLGEHSYKQDEVLPPGYYTDFVLWLDGSGRVLPIRSGPCQNRATAPEPDPFLCRVILSVNDKWHYCHNSEVLVGSRAMRDRHLRLLGYIILQLPYHELEKLNGIEEVKQYLHQKLLDVPL
uniref:Fas-activated serine/threonine kinase n=1 Tax=Xiphophorus couchianus TaxID=32473 RepID=A0A3B5KY16_9TELE